MPNSKEVGCAWKKTSQSGLKYLSVSLDLDKLLAATGGIVAGKINLALFTKKGEKTNDRQPDLDLVYSAPGKSSAMRQERAEEPVSEWGDEEIPF